MGSFWCSKCGDTLYGPDSESVSEVHKEFCIKQSLDAARAKRDRLVDELDAAEELVIKLEGKQR
jgi:hypothetical protein